MFIKYVLSVKMFQTQNKYIFRILHKKLTNNEYHITYKESNDEKYILTDRRLFRKFHKFMIFFLQKFAYRL